jgi:DNA-directed RNA polymerase subunit omega
LTHTEWIPRSGQSIKTNETDSAIKARLGIDIETEEELVKRVGGKFALTSLVMKRTVELNRGALPLVRVEPGERNLRSIVYREILEGKITLSAIEEVEYEKTPEQGEIEAGATESPPKEEGGEIYGSDIKKIKEQRIKELAQLLNPKK